mmetsp:Transcript_109538/g.341375  ORF Transcript_109538/g.341375 Transcript_109538/m.341375 type:complete len:270 (+) Transcript_109538:352-1161(+)
MRNVALEYLPLDGRDVELGGAPVHKVHEAVRGDQVVATSPPDQDAHDELGQNQEQHHDESVEGQHPGNGQPPVLLHDGEAPQLLDGAAGEYLKERPRLCKLAHHADRPDKLDGNDEPGRRLAVALLDQSRVGRDRLVQRTGSVEGCGQPLHVGLVARLRDHAAVRGGHESSRNGKGQEVRQGYPDPRHYDGPVLPAVQAAHDADEASAVDVVVHAGLDQVVVVVVVQVISLLLGVRVLAPPAAQPKGAEEAAAGAGVGAFAAGGAAGSA